jgi:hypothetical protein
MSCWRDVTPFGTAAANGTNVNLDRVLSQRPHDKDICRGENTIGCMYNLDLLMMGLWGLKHVEERR